MGRPCTCSEVRRLVERDGPTAASGSAIMMLSVAFELRRVNECERARHVVSTAALESRRVGSPAENEERRLSPARR
jgi:hypothetical protein